MDSAVVSAKGQVVIPAKIRRKLGIKQGTRLVFCQKGNIIKARPITEVFIDSLQDSLQAKPGE